MSRGCHCAGLSTFLLLTIFTANTQTQSTAPPPVAAKIPVTDEYHGVKVVDHYRWLEDGKSAETKRWVAAQNAYSLAYFKRAPAWNSILQDLKNPQNNPGATESELEFRNGRFFYLQLDRTRQQQAVLMTSTSLGTANSPPANAKVLLDPTVLDPSGHTSIDWYKPSLDGSLIAVGLAVGGSERSALTVLQTSTGKQVGSAFVPMGFPGAERSLAWLPGNKGFLYAGYDPAVASAAQSTVLENQKVFEHLLGTSQNEDRVVLDKGLTRLAQIALDSDPTGKWIVASAEDGDGGKYANFVRMPDGSWQQISTYSDEVVAITPGTAEEDALYLTSLKDAPRGKILKVSAKSPLLSNARVIIPEGTASVEHEDPGADSRQGRCDQQATLCDDNRRGTKPVAGLRSQWSISRGRAPSPTLRSFSSRLSWRRGSGDPHQWVSFSYCLQYVPCGSACATSSHSTFPACKQDPRRLCSRSGVCDLEGWDQDSHEYHSPARLCDGRDGSHPRLWLWRLQHQHVTGVP